MRLNFENVGIFHLPKGSKPHHYSKYFGSSEIDLFDKNAFGRVGWLWSLEGPYKPKWVLVVTKRSFNFMAGYQATLFSVERHFQILPKHAPRNLACEV